MFVAMYWQVIPAMVLDWWKEEGYSYGFLIPPLVAYVVWCRRHRITAQPALFDGRGLWLTGSACLVYLAGRLAVEFFLTRASLVLLLAGLVWTFWGLRRLQALSFPLVLLFSMIPLPTVVYYQVTAPLQLYSSSIATGVVRLLGLTIYRDGNVIYLPNISLGVAEACSGLHSALSLSITALLLGYVEFSRFRTKAALLAVAIPIAILFNIVRIAGTALLAETNPELATGFYHSFSGWIVYVAGSVALFAAARLLRVVLERRVTG
jgi:exosortase